MVLTHFVYVQVVGPLGEGEGALLSVVGEVGDVEAAPRSQRHHGGGGDDQTPLTQHHLVVERVMHYLYYLQPH